MKTYRPVDPAPLETRNFRLALFVLLASCLLLLVESTLLIRTRWVEDESWLVNGSWTLVREGRMRMTIFPANINNRADVSMPVQHLSMSAVFAATGFGIPQARLTSAAAGLATVVVVFFLALELGGAWCAMLATLLLATDTFLVIAARTARPEALTALLAWLSVLLYMRASRKDSGALMLASGVACGLGIVGHPVALPFAVFIGILFLARYGATVWRHKLPWLFVVGVLAAGIPYAAWCFWDADHAESFKHLYLGKAAEPMRGRIVGEASRWADFIGLSSQRVALGIRFPVRIHVPLILAGAFVVLFRARRDLAKLAALLFLLSFLWLVYMVNKGPRYLVLLSPLFALLLGWVAAYCLPLASRSLALLALAAVLITQVGSNAYWIYRYRHADYPAVTAELRRLIPERATVYGVTTFWMGLRDRTYYAYDRTPWDFARSTLRPEYLILYDRVMQSGSGQGEDNMADLREQLTAFVKEHGVLLGHVDNGFYGNLEVYRATY